MESPPTSLQNHWWWRPGWRLGRRAYTFHITFDRDTVGHSDELRRLVRDYQLVLRDIEGLDLVPIEWLHLTMQNVGFTDELGAEAVQSVAWRARERAASLSPFDLTFGPAHVRREAIALQPEPSAPVAALRQALTMAIQDVLGEDAVPLAAEHRHGYTPHVSVAYSNREAAATPIVRLLEAARPQPAQVTVRAASLIVLDRDDRVYRWTVVDHIPLEIE